MRAAGVDRPLDVQQGQAGRGPKGQPRAGDLDDPGRDHELDVALGRAPSRAGAAARPVRSGWLETATISASKGRRRRERTPAVRTRARLRSFARRSGSSRVARHTPPTTFMPAPGADADLTDHLARPSPHANDDRAGAHGPAVARLTDGACAAPVHDEAQHEHRRERHGRTARERHVEDERSARRAGRRGSRRRG